MMNRLSFGCAAVFLGAASSAIGAETVFTGDAKTAPVAASATASAAALTTADELLNALHGAGRDIRSLSADIRYTKKFAAIEGDESQVRIGRLWFRSTPGVKPGEASPAAEAKPDRAFRVDFTTLIVDDKLRDEPQTFIFDGEWLVERQPLQKLQWKRRVVAPGQKIDPLAIGEGPFPMPIGQSREKILERFTAELLPPSDGWPGARDSAQNGLDAGAPGEPGTAPAPSLAPEWLLRTYQLKLTPKPGTDEARKFESVRLWYDRATLLPRMALTDDGGGAFSEVLLTNVKTNAAAVNATGGGDKESNGTGAGAVTDDVFNIALPAGWDEKVDEFEDRSGQ